MGNSSYNRYAQINFTTAPSTGGYITIRYVSGLPSTGLIGLPLVASGQTITNYEDEGYWEITPDSYTGSLNSAVYTITLRGNTLTTVTDITIPRIIKSPGSTHASWVACGTYGSSSGTTSDFTINSTNVSGFSFFNIGSTDSSPLPLTIVEFSGMCSNDGVHLEWVTASEHNTSYFNIEKSRNGLDWDTIVTIEAAGNSNQSITYNYIDTKIIDQVNYYKLKQFDNDGSYETYNIISVNCGFNFDEPIIVYPNPSESIFIVSISNQILSDVEKVEIFDVNGSLIETYKVFKNNFIITF